MIAAGDLKHAGKLVDDARALDVKWGLFDDTPDKVSAALPKPHVSRRWFFDPIASIRSTRRVLPFRRKGDLCKALIAPWRPRW